MYWIYRTRILSCNQRPVQARLVDPSPRSLRQVYGASSFSSPAQLGPYGVDLRLIYQIHAADPPPDVYPEGTGFTLYSRSLIVLMEAFKVKFEAFPVTMIDEQGRPHPELDYAVFHCLEGVLPAMDEKESGWTGDHDAGIPRLVLDLTAFEHRPLFFCNHVYVPLIRDDLKQAIQRHGITGFGFLRTERYCSGRYGVAPVDEE